jgi:CubicO group peptidase (beta-lactamase class C family)
VDDVVAKVLDRHARRHTGLVAGVLRDGERRVAARGDVATDSIFEIGSITKTFTALVLARMAQDGRAALDERPFRGQDITLADLATHMSGFPPPAAADARARLRERRDPYASIGEAAVPPAPAGASPRATTGAGGPCRRGRSTPSRARAPCARPPTTCSPTAPSGSTRRTRRSAPPRA